MPLPKRPALLAVAALAISVVLGLALASWLSWRAPLSPMDSAEADTASLIAPPPAGDLPEPPQPLLDGGRGVPDRAAPTHAPPPLVSVLGVDSAASPSVGNDAGTLPAAPSATGAGSTVVTVRSEQQAANANKAQANTAPATAAPSAVMPSAPASNPAPVAKPTGAAWLDALRADLAACQAEGLFTRVVCQERARWRHCEPAQAWGSVPECPSTRPAP